MNELTIDLSKEEYAIIRNALLELPARVSLELLNKLDVQVAIQLKIQEKENVNN